jgi:nucleotide-binding universal stress UspA family protein
MPYKHILVATDGSELSLSAIHAAVEIAQKFRARLTSLYVVREGVPTAFSGSRLYASKLASREYKQAIEKAADEALAVVHDAARAARVRHSSARASTPRPPWAAIVRAAQQRKCDLIVMASHGKRGVRALGSQTMKTIAHTRIPVLVCR